jgi:hypothetical protein
MRSLLVVFLLLTVCVAQMNAVTTLTVKKYRSDMASDLSRQILTVYIRGMGEGMMWINTRLQREKRPLFCLAEQVVLNDENYIDIIDAQIKKLAAATKPAELDEMQIGTILMYGLQATFPCNAK